MQSAERNPDMQGGDTKTLRGALWVSSLLMGAATLCLGLLVIIGWHTGNRTLIQVQPQFVPMQYNTALGFVVCGVSLVLHCIGFRRSVVAAGCRCTSLRPSGASSG